MMIAHITSLRPLQGFVINADKMDTAVHCQCSDDGQWEPLFGIRIGEVRGRFELPYCFELAQDAIDALDEAVAEQ